MKISEMKKKKNEKGYSVAYISEKTGLPVGTLTKIFSGQTKRPRRETMETLEKFFSSGRAVAAKAKNVIGRAATVKARNAIGQAAANQVAANQAAAAAATEKSGRRNMDPQKKIEEASGTPAHFTEETERVSIKEIADKFGFKCLTPEVDASELFTTEADINRPALQLAGFYDYFVSRRVQLLGNVECAYLDSLEEKTRHEKIEALLSKKIPCLVYCRNHKPYPDTIELANKYGVALYTTPTGTSEMSEKIIHYLEMKMSQSITIHGVLIDVFGEGVLITGESGIGKSEAALELIKRGHRLVADDAVVIHRVDEETLIGSAPDITRDFIEIRGIGVVDVKSLFGLESVKPEQTINFVIQIEDWNKEKEYDRLGNADEYMEILGNKILKYTLPLRPGRNLAVIVEAVAVNYRQRTLGYNATEELYRRIQENMLRNR